jgi:threonylcarbamoyladenosine tRNA methylthiotransferase MtaB
MDISYLHVFTYSERENTIAAQMEGAVPGAQRSDRSKMLHILSEKKRRAFYEQNLGKIEEVLFESDVKDGYMHGFSKNYVKVRTPYDPLLVNEVLPVKFLSISSDGDVDVEELPELLVH